MPSRSGRVARLNAGYWFPARYNPVPPSPRAVCHTARPASRADLGRADRLAGRPSPSLRQGRTGDFELATSTRSDRFLADRFHGQVIVATPVALLGTAKAGKAPSRPPPPSCRQSREPVRPIRQSIAFRPITFLRPAPSAVRVFLGSPAPAPEPPKPITSGSAGTPARCSLWRAVRNVPVRRHNSRCRPVVRRSGSGPGVHRMKSQQRQSHLRRHDDVRGRPYDRTALQPRAVRRRHRLTPPAGLLAQRYRSCRDGQRGEVRRGLCPVPYHAGACHGDEAQRDRPEHADQGYRPHGRDSGLPCPSPLRAPADRTLPGSRDTASSGEREALPQDPAAAPRPWNAGARSGSAIRTWPPQAQGRLRRHSPVAL